MGAFAVLLAFMPNFAHADGRPGAIEFSDGHKLSGAISLTPGKQLRLFSGDKQVAVALDEVKELRFKPEKEEMREGFYFPDAGQATQAKTGEIYPVRYLQTDILLSDGKVLSGHLFTTTLFVEADDTTQKVVLMAKQTGEKNQKVADIIYATAVRFDATAAGGFSRIDLSKAGFAPQGTPVVVVRPELTQPPLQQDGDKPVWMMPVRDPALVLFAVLANDGIHVSWPSPEADAPVQAAVKKGLADMYDFFDTRESLGTFLVDDDNAYSLVMLKRVAATYGEPGKEPWSLVMLRWKYDADAKKVVLIGRVLIKLGGVHSNPKPPPVLKEPGLLNDITAGKP